MQQCAAAALAKPSAVEALRDDEAVLAIVTLEELGKLTGSVEQVGRHPHARQQPRVCGRFRARGLRERGALRRIERRAGAVRTSSKVADTAFDLLYYLCNDAISQEIVHNPLLGGGPVRDPLRGNRPGGSLTGSTKRTPCGCARPSATPPIRGSIIPASLFIPDQATHRAALVAAIRQALHDKSDPAAALAAVDQKWRQLDGDPAKARTLYRMSLGF